MEDGNRRRLTDIAVDCTIVYIRVVAQHALLSRLGVFGVSKAEPRGETAQSDESESDGCFFAFEAAVAGAVAIARV